MSVRTSLKAKILEKKNNNNFKKHTEDFLYMDLGFMENGPASLPDVLC